MDADVREGFVERFARVYESNDASRIEGRIFAHLATAAEPYLSLQELAEQLGVSRGAVSINTRRLIALNLLERVPVPGARGEHYGLTATGPEAVFAMLSQRVRALVEIVEEGIALQPDRVTAGTTSLRAMRDTYCSLDDMLQTFLAARKRAQ